MSEIKDGGPAFPVSTREAGAPNESAYGHQDGYDTWQFGGLTMRDYFAAKAMQGLIAASGDSNGVVDYAENPIADSAYAMADAMIRARGE
jgi:hypothetical protein